MAMGHGVCISEFTARVFQESKHLSWLLDQFALWLAACIDLTVCSREWSGDDHRAPKRPRHRRGDIDVQRSIFADKSINEAKNAMSKHMMGRAMLIRRMRTRVDDKSYVEGEVAHCEQTHGAIAMMR